MNVLAPTAHPTIEFKKAGWRDAGALFALAWLVPLAVHLVPWQAERPLGAYLLPMFWTTLVAGYFYGAGLGLLTGLFAPALNLLLTGLPAWRAVGFASFELALFVAAFAFTLRRWPRVVLLAPLGYVIAKLGVTGLRAALDDSGVSAVALGHSFVRALAGLVVLAALNAALVWFFPKTAREET